MLHSALSQSSLPLTGDRAVVGRRNPLRSLFGAQHLPHQVSRDSYAGRMGAVQPNSCHDDDLGQMYWEDSGWPDCLHCVCQA